MGPPVDRAPVAKKGAIASEKSESAETQQVPKESCVTEPATSDIAINETYSLTQVELKKSEVTGEDGKAKNTPKES